MRKIFAILAGLAILFSLCSCQKDSTDTAQSTVTATEDLYSGDDSSETSAETATKALEAYSSYIASFSGEGNITNALVTDLDKNDIPEVIFTYYGDHNMYILSYGENDGLSVISPVLHSSTPARVFYSKDDAVLYYTDSGHNKGTSWYHEGVCLKATAEGFETIGTVSGDTWDNVSDEIWENEDAFEETDKAYDKAFEDSMSSLFGQGKYIDFFEACEKEDAEKYLEEKLSVDFTAERDEYSEFEKTAVSAIGTEPISINIADYDRNGTYEAFALTGKKVSEEVQGDYYDGTVWFVSDEGKATSLGDYDCWSDGEVLECQYNSYYQINIVAGSSSPAVLWKVSGNKCEEITEFKENGTDCFKSVSVNAHSNSLISTLNAFDATLEDLNDSHTGTGHTFKPYFYYDTPDGIKEYGGIEINKAQLEALGGGDYIDLIEKDGYTVKNIYVRENGIININIYKYDGEYFYDCNYINLKTTVGGVSALDEEMFATGIPNEIDEISGEGFYKAASVPDLATYPEANNYPETSTTKATEAKTVTV